MIQATIQDAVAIGFCAKGVRKWFGASGLDFRSFVRHGIEVERLEETGDARALAVAAQARKRNHVR